MNITREEVETLGAIACFIDELKNRLESDLHRAQLFGAVNAIHGVAEGLDLRYGYGLYDADTGLDALLVLVGQRMGSDCVLSLLDEKEEASEVPA